MQLWQYCFLVTARSLYISRTLSASIIRSTKTVVAATGACHESGLYISSKDVLTGYTGCPGRNVPDFGRMFLKLKYTDITQNTYIQS